MRNLPSARVNASNIFSHVGIDFAGPIRVQTGRGHKSFKGCVCLFICFFTKAIHLEVVSGLDTRSFLHAFKRFLARRGLCTHIYSDYGTNFIGADTEIKEIFAQNSS